VKSFDRLTKLGRARRLREVAWQALEAYDLDVARVRLVNNESNCTFRVDAADGSSYALRINLPGMRTREEIHSELVWQEALRRDTDIAVPKPIRARNGDLVVEVSGDGVPETRCCNLSGWVYGATLSRSRTPGNFNLLGRLAARLHRHAATFEPPPGFDVPTLDATIPPGPPDVLFEGGEVNRLPDCARSIIIEMKGALDDELRRTYQAEQQPQLIHGDLHWWNVLVYRGTLHPIDFEDCAWAFPIQEIAITFYYVLWDARFPIFLEAFRRGYGQFQPWPEEYAGQLELMMGQRALDLLNLLMASPYANERELIPEYVEIINQTYRPHFERWKSLHI
jgi:Ser/Thr protein kinase RdoA (MazF antagonist)